ncbi:MAG: DUF4198 domain-containing protein [Planctomycetota bacterium]|nr:DUF4198 domain-containing protein [Planctomycetota bacterium]
MLTLRITALAAVFVLTASSAAAHDFWIEASKHRPVVGERVDIDLRVGEKWIGEAVERNPLRIVRFDATDAAGKIEPIVGIDKRAPAGLWRPKSAGLFVIGYESNTIPIELEPAKFEHYLEAEGLQHVITARQERGESAKKGLEIYARSVKSFVLASPSDKTEPSTIGWDRRLGLTLEIVPEKDPHTLKIGDELPVRVFFRDQPLGGALVGCMPRSNTESDVRLRTNDEGRTTFKLAADGVQMLRVCWMVAAPKDSGSDWQSAWSSLTFDVRAPAVRPTK